MKHRKITTILILSTVFMGFFLTLNRNLLTSESSISKRLNLSGQGGDVWFSSVSTQTVGDTFETKIYVNTSSQKLNTYGIEISFDPNVIIVLGEADGVVAGDDGFISAKNVINADGWMNIAGFDAFGKGPSFQLHLLTINWTAIGPGTSSLDLYVDILEDQNLNSIGTPNAIDSSIVVGGGSVETPVLNSPSDVSYNEGETGNSITWTATDDNPTTYTVTQDGNQVDSGSWSSDSGITMSVDNLSVGSYIYNCIVNDGDGLSDSDSVTVTVVPDPSGDVWFSSVSTQYVRDTFETEIYVNTSNQNIGAYEFDIAYNKSVIRIERAHHNIVAGAEGFVSKIYYLNDSRGIRISGFDDIGKGPSFQLHLLTITWNALVEGISLLDLSINVLEDTDGNSIGTPNDIDGSVVVEINPEAPVLNSPTDIADIYYYQESTTGHSLTWRAIDDNPTTYRVTRNGQEVAFGLWSSGVGITVNIDGLFNGYWSFICTVFDGDGFSDTDYVRVRVTPVNVGNVWFSEVSTQTVDDTFETEIYVNTSKRNLADYEFDIAYNESVIRIASANDIVAGAEGFVSEVNNDNDNGLVTIAGFDPEGRDPSFQLHLLTITWTAVGVGTSSLDLTIITLKEAIDWLIGTPTDIDGSVVVERAPVQAPVLNSPLDVYYQEDTTGHSITWIAIDTNPTTYTVTRDGNQVASGSWSSGFGFTVSVDGLSVGSYTYTCTVNDEDGLLDSDSVIVTIDLDTGGDVWFSSVSTQTVGDTFETEIYLNTGSQNLGAYGFDIAYNEDVIQIASANDIVAGAEGFISAVKIDNGLVTIAGFETGDTGPSFQLHVLTITWTAVGEGNSSLDLSIDVLIDARTITIGTPNDIDGSVEVEEVLEVPGDGEIPGYDLSIFLVSLWITVLGVIYLRKRRQ